jgi:hypothetical protein
MIAPLVFWSYALANVNIKFSVYDAFLESPRITYIRYDHDPTIYRTPVSCVSHKNCIHFAHLLNTNDNKHDVYLFFLTYYLWNNSKNSYRYIRYDHDPTIYRTRGKCANHKPQMWSVYYWILVQRPVVAVQIISSREHNCGMRWFELQLLVFVQESNSKLTTSVVCD